MPADEIHLNDIGTTFTITVKDGTTPVDLSTATTLNIVFVKPNGDPITRTATPVSGGADGVISYTTVDGDLNAVGTWCMQAVIAIGSSTWHTDIVKFKVHRNLA